MNMHKAMVAALMTAVLAGCAKTEGQQRATTGALVGGAGGALVGQAIGGNTQSTVIWCGQRRAAGRGRRQRDHTASAVNSFCCVHGIATAASTRRLATTATTTAIIEPGLGGVEVCRTFRQ